MKLKLTRQIATALAITALMLGLTTLARAADPTNPPAALETTIRVDPVTSLPIPPPAAQWIGADWNDPGQTLPEVNPKMRPEKRELIESLMGEEEAARRTATLQAGERILWRRVAWRSFGGIAVLAVTELFIVKTTGPQPRPLTAVVEPQEQTGSLTDAELLGMFPNTPVGLATLANGKKRLIFPRPGDEARFMARY